MTIKIIVVTHKKYEVPNNDLYYPICVGSNIKQLSEFYHPDNSGENISEKNETYCELTALYWAWKNITADYLGIVHYRRYLSLQNKCQNLSGIIKKEEIKTIIQNNKIIVSRPKKYFATIEDHYINSKKGYKDVHKSDIKNLRHAVNIISPEYNSDLNEVLSDHCAHMLNMFIMNYKMFDQYCNWLFSIIDKTVELSDNRKDQKRYAGALSEFLLDVWIKHNNYTFFEAEVFKTEHQTILNKIFQVIKRRV